MLKVVDEGRPSEIHLPLLLFASQLLLHVSGKLISFESILLGLS
jgi:hypothetical protein